MLLRKRECAHVNLSELLRGSDPAFKALRMRDGIEVNRKIPSQNTYTIFRAYLPVI